MSNIFNTELHKKLTYFALNPANFRAFVTGTPASGKSTFTENLGNKLGVPFYHGDILKRETYSKMTPHNKFIYDVNRIKENQNWIYDGSLTNDPENKLEELMLLADIIFNFDFLPTEFIFWAKERFRLLQEGIHAKGFPPSTNRNSLRSWETWIEWLGLYLNEKPDLDEKIALFKDKIITFTNPYERDFVFETIPEPEISIQSQDLPQGYILHNGVIIHESDLINEISYL